jgi:hypothetical protein
VERGLDWTEITISQLITDEYKKIITNQEYNKEE